MKKRTKIFLVTCAVLFIVLTITTALLIRHANKILKYEIETLLGKNFSVQEIRLTWGEVNAFDVRFRDRAGREIFKTSNLIVNADFKGLLKKEYVISNLVLINPSLVLETDRKGNIVGFTAQKEQTGDRKIIPPFFIKKIKIVDGSLDYLDGKVSTKPVLTKIRDIELELKDVMFPLGEQFSDYSVAAGIPGTKGTGIMNSKGKINFLTRDMDSAIIVKNIDITGFKPYFQKKGDVNITRGFLDLDMGVKVSSKKIRAPGKATLKDLQFDTGRGIGDRFLSIPLSALVSFMKKKDQISFNFTVEGNLDNPRFNLRENLIEQITIGLAEKLGLSVTRIGESIVVLGEEGASQVGKGIKDIGEGIRNLFK